MKQSEHKKLIRSVRKLLKKERNISAVARDIQANGYPEITPVYLNRVSSRDIAWPGVDRLLIIYEHLSE